MDQFLKVNFLFRGLGLSSNIIKEAQVSSISDRHLSFVCFVTMLFISSISKEISSRMFMLTLFYYRDLFSLLVIGFVLCVTLIFFLLKFCHARNYFSFCVFIFSAMLYIFWVSLSKFSLEFSWGWHIWAGLVGFICKLFLRIPLIWS